MTIHDPKQHLRFHNLLLMTISGLYKVDQVLDHPLYYYKIDLVSGLNLPERKTALPINRNINVIIVYTLNF